MIGFVVFPSSPSMSYFRMFYFSLHTTTKSAIQIALFGLIWLVVATQSCVAQQVDQRIQLWIDRTVETTIAVATASNKQNFDKEYSLAMAALALGRVGCKEEALEIFDRSGLADSTEDRQKGLLALADGLSTGDFVDCTLGKRWAKKTQKGKNFVDRKIRSIIIPPPVR